MSYNIYIHIYIFLYIELFHDYYRDFVCCVYWLEGGRADSMVSQIMRNKYGFTVVIVIARANNPNVPNNRKNSNNPKLLRSRATC
jgi:hypothetical protein